MRYNKADINDCLLKAKQRSIRLGKAQFVFSTRLGFLISDKKPDFGLQHYIVTPDGEINFIEYNITNKKEK